MACAGRDGRRPFEKSYWGAWHAGHCILFCTGDSRPIGNRKQHTAVTSGVSPANRPQAIPGRCCFRRTQQRRQPQGQKDGCIYTCLSRPFNCWCFRDPLTSGGILDKRHAAAVNQRKVEQCKRESLVEMKSGGHQVQAMKRGVNRCASAYLLQSFFQISAPAADRGDAHQAGENGCGRPLGRRACQRW